MMGDAAPLPVAGHGGEDGEAAVDLHRVEANHLAIEQAGQLDADRRLTGSRRADEKEERAQGWTVRPEPGEERARVEGSLPRLMPRSGTLVGRLRRLGRFEVLADGVDAFPEDDL